MMKQTSADVRRVGTAIIGGDFTGNARGANALDIQTGRASAVDVASGTDSIGLGQRTTSSGLRSIAIGSDSVIHHTDSIGIGNFVYAGAANTIQIGASTYSFAANAISIGSGAWASGVGSISIGRNAYASTNNMIDLSGLIMSKRDTGEPPADRLAAFAGTPVLILTHNLDLTTVAEHTITLPTGPVACRIWLNEIGIIATNVVGLTIQPTIRFGISGQPAKHRVATQTTSLTASLKRDQYTPLVGADGETTLTFGITIGAVATTMTGRAYFLGIIVQNQ